MLIACSNGQESKRFDAVSSAIDVCCARSRVLHLRLLFISTHT